MRAFWHILKLDFLSALRSKTVLLLTIICSAWVIFGKHILKFDSSSSGAYELSVRYLLGAVFAIVLISIGAMAAGAISADRETKRLQLTLLKPVPYYLIAMARVVAITLIGAFVLAISSLLLWANIGRDRVCYHVYEPTMQPLSEAAKDYYDIKWEKDPKFREAVADKDKDEILSYLEGYIRDSYLCISKGEEVHWDFSSVPETSFPMFVRVRTTSPLGSPDDAVGEFRFNNKLGKLETINNNLSLVLLDENKGVTPKEDSKLYFKNTSDSLINLQPRKDIHILVEADSFFWNIVRAWLIMTFLLGILVSIGVFLGSALGRGVAIFAVISFLIAMVVAPTTLDELPDPTSADGVGRFSLRMTSFAASITSSLNAYGPITSVENNECVEIVSVACCGATFLVYLLVFSCLSGFAMSSKSISSFMYAIKRFAIKRRSHK